MIYLEKIKKCLLQLLQSARFRIYQMNKTGFVVYLTGYPNDEKHMDEQRGPQPVS